jgi:hypothetical protein
VRPEPHWPETEEPERRTAGAKRGTMKPTVSQMVFVGTRFSIGLLIQPGKRAGQLGPSALPTPTTKIYGYRCMVFQYRGVESPDLHAPPVIK